MTPNTGSAHLVIRDLACRRGNRVLFEHFDLDLRPGELVWLRAANGFGKTTLLRVLAGLAKPEAGTLVWNRRDGDARAALASSRPSPLYLGHANALKDDLTVLESLRHLADLHGLDATELAMHDALQAFGLHTRRDAPIRTLSQGQRRRVALMRLRLSDPRATWILDEPFDALDADGLERVGALLIEHAARGGNVLFTSHVAPVLDSASLRTVHLDAFGQTATTIAAMS